MNWLNTHRKKIHSQYGEEGVLEAVWDLFGKKGVMARGEHWCVEFGAGRDNNNTSTFIDNQGWHGVLIEANPAFFADLEKKYAGQGRVTTLKKLVQFAGDDTLDAILARTKIPKNFDLLIIDIDGNDIHVWESLVTYEPQVVMIEYNGRIPYDISFAQPRDGALGWGSSLKAMVELGKKKGYELVYAYVCNAVFVKKELFPLFEVIDNRPEALVEPFWPKTRWFQLYDGTIVLHGTERKKMLNFKKKIAKEPVYLLANGELSPVTFRRDRRLIRIVKQLIKKTFLFTTLYPIVSGWYGRAWRRKRQSL